MKLDEYQIQRVNRIVDNLVYNLMALIELRNRAASYDETHFANGVSSLLDQLTGGVITDVKELKLYSERKADKEVKNNAEK